MQVTPPSQPSAYYIESAIAADFPLGYHVAMTPARPRNPILVIIAIISMTAFGAILVAGTPDLKTYPASDFKDAAYLQKMHQKVGAAWKRPPETPKAPGKSVVIVTILRDGSLLESRLHMKSGVAEWDASALDAIKKASPFDPLPKSYPRTSVEVHFHFEYN